MTTELVAMSASDELAHLCPGCRRPYVCTVMARHRVSPGRNDGDSTHRPA